MLLSYLFRFPLLCTSFIPKFSRIHCTWWLGYTPILGLNANPSRIYILHWYIYLGASDIE